MLPVTSRITGGDVAGIMVSIHHEHLDKRACNTFSAPYTVIFRIRFL